VILPPLEFLDESFKASVILASKAGALNSPAYSPLPLGDEEKKVL
jgi:hypothetical protein